MSYNDIVDADQRLVLLRVLAEDGDYSHNEYVLQEALREMGHNISNDKLRTELSWLKEQRLITIDSRMTVWIAALTVRGDDVAQGRVIVPGVKRPRPGQ